MSAGPYDSSGYSGHNGGPITDGSDLNCDFSSSCCWQNSPDSQIQWQTGTGTPESAKIKKNFGTTTMPSKLQVKSLHLLFSTNIFNFSWKLFGRTIRSCGWSYRSGEIRFLFDHMHNWSSYSFSEVI